MDYNDYMDIAVKNRAMGMARFIPAVVVVSAFAGFIGLAWYAYHNGSQSLKDEDLVVVEADKTPMKDKPLDPGGLKFPNQDKTIFENFAGNVQNQPRVERVMPQPEEPMPKSLDTSQTTTWVNDKQQTSHAATPVKETVMGKDSAKVADQSYKPVPTPEPEPPKKSEVIEQKPSGSDIKTFAASPKTVEREPKIASKGNAKIQLGAYRSEKEAQEAFGIIQKKFSELAGKKSQIARADLGEKGIFYRLRVVGMGTANDAKSFCQKLSAKGQPCLVAAE